MPSLRERICHWVDEALSNGTDLNAAYLAALERIRKEGLQRDLLDTFGGELIAAIYERQTTRPAALPAVVGRPVKPFRDPASVAKPVAVPRLTPAPGVRRVDVTQLRRPGAYLSALVTVDGEQTTLGELRGHQCRLLQFVYESQIEDANRKAAAFKAMADSLAGGQRVRDRYNEDSLRLLLGDSIEDLRSVAA